MLDVGALFPSMEVDRGQAHCATKTDSPASGRATRCPSEQRRGAQLRRFLQPRRQRREVNVNTKRAGTGVARALLVLSSFALACCNFAAPRYAVSVENVTTLRALRGRPVSVGTFDAKPGSEGASVSCRAGG